MTAAAHQVLVGASVGDAITTEALLLRDVLRRSGPSEVLASRIDPRLAGEVRPLGDAAALPGAGAGETVLLLHPSVADPGFDAFLRARGERLVLRYHNVTPPEMVERFDPEFAAALRRARAAIAALRPRLRGAVADSRFNAADLEAMGYRDVAVAPVVVDLTGLVATPPADAPHFPLPAPDAGPLVLVVGRIAPNKRHDAALAAFDVLRSRLHPDAHLLVVGGGDVPAYRDALDRFAAALDPGGVVLAGHVTPSELVAAYRRADVLLSLSDHEGFGVPLVEAMAFGVPVVAAAAGAVAATVDGAGLVLPERPGPALAAEALAAVLEDGALRQALIERGRRRAAELHPDVTGPALAAAVLAAAGR